MDLQTRDRATADVAPLPAGQPGVRLPGDRAGARAPAPGFLSGVPSRRAALVWLAIAAVIALGLAVDAGVAGPAAVPAIVRSGVAALVLFGMCGYGPARLLLPGTLRVGLFVLPVGAACSTLALTVLGLLHVPLPVSLGVVLACGVVLGVVALRRPPRAGPRGDRVVSLAVPLALAALIAAIALLPSFRAGFATVQGQNGDAILAVGTADFLRHAPPTAVRPQLGLDRVPITWRSKLPIYYGLAATSELAGQDATVAFSTVAAIVLGLACLGFYAFAVEALGAPLGVGLLLLFAIGLDRIVVYTAIHPYFNQTWALFALPYVLLFGWLALRRPERGTVALLAVFTALAIFTYPLLLPFPAVFAGVLAWRRRRDLDWRSAPRLPRRPLGPAPGRGG